MQLLHGIRYTVTAPIDYSVSYLNGTINYKHPFVVIDIRADLVAKFEAQADLWINGLLTALNTGGLVAGGIPVALTGAISAVIQVAYNAAKSWIMNADGSASLAFSYNWAGTRKSGIDLTAWPIPGFDPKIWNNLINQMMKYRFNMALTEKIDFNTLSSEELNHDFQIEATGISAEGNSTKNE